MSVLDAPAAAPMPGGPGGQHPSPRTGEGTDPGLGTGLARRSGHSGFEREPAALAVTLGHPQGQQFPRLRRREGAEAPPTPAPSTPRGRSAACHRHARGHPGPSPAPRRTAGFLGWGPARDSPGAPRALTPGPAMRRGTGRRRPASSFCASASARLLEGKQRFTLPPRRVSSLIVISSPDARPGRRCCCCAGAAGARSQTCGGDVRAANPEAAAAAPEPCAPAPALPSPLARAARYVPRAPPAPPPGPPGWSARAPRADLPRGGGVGARRARVMAAGRERDAVRAAPGVLRLE